MGGHLFIYRNIRVGEFTSQHFFKSLTGSLALVSFLSLKPWVIQVRVRVVRATFDREQESIWAHSTHWSATLSVSCTYMPLCCAVATNNNCLILLANLLYAIHSTQCNNPFNWPAELFSLFSYLLGLSVEPIFWYIFCSERLQVVIMVRVF